MWGVSDGKESDPGTGDSLIHALYPRRAQDDQRLEGDVEIKIPGPYKIPYSSIIPKRKECTNLVVPVCVSASHIAYGSIRMEPVFMSLFAVAAIAASLTIDNNKPLQDINPAEIKRGILN